MRFRMAQGLASDFEFCIILPEWDARQQRQLTPGQRCGDEPRGGCLSSPVAVCHRDVVGSKAELDSARTGGPGPVGSSFARRGAGGGAGDGMVIPAGWAQPPAAGVGTPLGQLRLQSPIRIASKSWFAAAAESGSKAMLPGWQVPPEIRG